MMARNLTFAMTGRGRAKRDGNPTAPPLGAHGRLRGWASSGQSVILETSLLFWSIEC